MENLTRKQRRKLIRENQKEKQKQSNNYLKIKKILMYIIGCLVLVIGGYFLLNEKNNNNPSVAGEENTANNVWIRGNEQGKIRLTVFSDFQCPACAIYSKTIDTLWKKYGDSLRIEFKHFPLNIHKNALKASRAAEAAGMQNKFWDMHDILFDKQSQWANEKNPDNIFFDYAKEIGLDLDKFKNDYDNSNTDNKINQDMKDARILRINSTPTFLLNDTILENMSPQNLENEIEKII